MHTITATIIARGAASTVPDDPTAVDAEIIVDGVTVGEVTLRIDPANSFTSLVSWGDLDNWATWDLQEWFALVEGDVFESNHGGDPHNAAIYAAREAADLNELAEGLL